MRTKSKIRTETAVKQDVLLALCLPTEMLSACVCLWERAGTVGLKLYGNSRVCVGVVFWIDTCSRKRVRVLCKILICTNPFPTVTLKAIIAT